MKDSIMSLVLTEPHHLVLEERPVPVPGPTDVLIKLRAASICHTDFFTLRGEYPGTKYPTVLGHEFSGTVEQCGEGVRHLEPEDRVTAIAYAYCGICAACRCGLHNACRNVLDIPFHMDGAYQEMICLPATMLFPFDGSLSFAEAALTEPAANGYAAADRASILPGEDVAVIGPGPIGLLALQAARLKSPGSLTMLGTRLERLQLAADFGATQTINVRETNPYDAMMDLTGGKGVDVAILCAGTEDAWELCCRILAPYGRAIVEALPPTCETRWSVPVFDFTAKHLSFLGVCGYTAGQFGVTLKLIQSNQIDVASLITHRFALRDYEEAFETSEKRKGGAIKVVFEIGN